MNKRETQPRFANANSNAVPIDIVKPGSPVQAISNRIEEANAAGANWLRSTSFQCVDGQFALLPDAEGRPERVVACLPAKRERLSGDLLGARLFEALPPGNYCLPKQFLERNFGEIALAALFAQYRLPADATRQTLSHECARVQMPSGPETTKALCIAQSEFLCRDLINLPASSMGPEELEAAAERVASEFGARMTVTAGRQLLDQDLPMIHAVGRGAEQEPRLLDISWGDSGPEIVLIGKGVCFDSGGLNVKSFAGMRHMKKDMAGAATALALARCIMALALPLRLRVLIPAVENAISGNVMRPGDILNSRKGLTVEIVSTDAEGRLVLADAMSLAEESSPDLIVTFATLTGAARIALGADMPAFFSTDAGLVERVMRHAAATRDPVWHMPLWKPYRSLLKSKVAHIANASESGLAGAITAALFLEEFLSGTCSFMHFDMFGWSDGKSSGYTAGGKGQVYRALLSLFENWPNEK